jgi:sugar/nucleoside kinase (ribokinase family)
MNWTMLSSMTGIWRAVARDVLPAIDKPARPAMFVDLADPAKRSESDLRDAIDALRELNALCPVTLGCNFSESARIASAIGESLPDDENDLARRAAALREHTGLTGICLHTRRRAAAAMGGDSFAFDAAFTNEPAISTGAGDTFNAGYALGLALGLPIAQRLALGVANSGFYVRNRKPPSLQQLASFLRDLPEPDRA